MRLGTATVLRANARELPLADNSVDLVVTSPPYFALRSYQDGGEHYAGQIGSEPTPAEFVDALLEVTRECMRVLKPSGSLWVNLGDSYSGRSGGPQGATGDRASRSQSETYGDRRHATSIDAPAKSLRGTPWRYALRCIDDLGLILRAEVIWSKPNGLPESVTDRVRRSHEQWFHFTLEPRYFSAVDEIREAHAPGTHQRRLDGQPSPKQAAGLENGTRRGYMAETYTNPLGKLPGSVWTIATEPLKVPDHLGIDHFAAFPTEWPRRIIQGWSPGGVCVECGEGRRPVVHRATLGFDNNPRNGMGGGDKDRWVAMKSADPDRITGYACACLVRQCESCAGSGYAQTYDGRTLGSCSECDGEGYAPLPPTRPAVVLDPFGGTGTTAMVAKALGRHGISVDMSADYGRLAQWRTNDRNQLAKVLGVEKVDAPDPEQLDLFGGDAA